MLLVQSFIIFYLLLGVHRKNCIAGDRRFLPNVRALVDAAELLFLFQAIPEQFCRGRT
jgi:hypothetical protein